MIVYGPGTELLLAKKLLEYLNKPPFSRNLTLVSLDEQEPPALLQLLNDVLAEISPDHKMNLREEDPEQTVIRMLGLLRVLKYKPNNAGMPFRQGLVQGAKEVIYPLMVWGLSHLAELQKRAYLARFLQKVEVPPEIMQDEEVQTAHAKYEELLEQFKEAHKSVETLRNSGISAADVKKDIAAMEEEKEQLRKRLERMRKKIETLQGHEKMLAAARALRLEREREETISASQVDQKNQLMHAEQKLQRLGQELREARANSFTGGVDGLVMRAEEDVKMNTYLTSEKLPQAIRDKEKQCSELRKVVEEPAMTEDDLELLHRRIQDVTSECNSLFEKKMTRREGDDDKLALFRQQASLISRKKESTSERLQELISERDALAAKQPANRSSIKAEDFKKFVAKLRIKSNEYKTKKQELSELQAEHLVLARTEEILRAKDESAKAFVSSLEAKKGVSGFIDMQDNLEKVSSLKSTLDERKGKTLEDISQMVAQLTKMIESKKTELSPAIRELRALRSQAQEVETEYEDKKAVYDSMTAGIESNRSKLDQEVRALREEVAAEESRWHQLQIQQRVLQTTSERVQREMQSYVTSVAPGQQRKSLRDAFSRKVQEQETTGKTLRERQRVIKDAHQPGLKQLDIWKDLERLLDCKMKCRATQRSPAPPGDSDRLVL